MVLSSEEICQKGCADPCELYPNNINECQYHDRASRVAKAQEEATRKDIGEWLLARLNVSNLKIYCKALTGFLQVQSKIKVTPEFTVLEIEALKHGNII